MRGQANGLDIERQLVLPIRAPGAHQ
jgi:hypothetical protein